MESCILRKAEGRFHLLPVVALEALLGEVNGEALHHLVRVDQEYQQSQSLTSNLSNSDME